MTNDDELRRHASDPTTSLELLAELAYQHPDLRAVVASNPATYPGLLEWLAQIGDPEIDAAIARRSVDADADAEIESPPAAFSTRLPESETSSPHPELPSTVTGRRPRKKLLLILAAFTTALVLVVAVVVIAVIVPQRQLAEAQADFASALSDLVSAQEWIRQEATEATDLLDKTSPSSVADSSTLNRLKDTIAKVLEVDLSVPIKRETTAGLRAQIRELSRRQANLDQLSAELSDRSDAVNSSVHDLKVQAVTSRETHSITVTDGNGNSQRITVSIGSWVKGSDPALLDEAWSIVGGEGPMPITDDGGFTASDGAFVFGTVSIENLTTDFPAENFANGNSWVYLSPLVRFDGFFTNWHGPEYEGMGATLQARQYSSGAQSDAVSGSNPLIRAAMSSNRWGPAPFVLALDTVFTPKYPEGNPKFDEVVFSLEGTFGAKVEGDSSFSIDRSW